MSFKLQWIDANGYHQIESNDYAALHLLWALLADKNHDNLEFWDMTNNAPARII